MHILLKKQSDQVSLFAIPTRILLIPALIITILFEKKKIKVFKILEHLLYLSLNEFMFCFRKCYTADE